LYVSNLSFGAPPGIGQIVRIELPNKPAKNQVHINKSTTALPVNVVADTLPESSAPTQQPSGFMGQPIVIETGNTDSALQEDASTKLSEDSELSSVSVSISEGRAVLTGTVSSAGAKMKAEKLIKSMHGLTSIENKISVSRQ
jgi:hypothetical protein